MPDELFRAVLDFPLPPPGRYGVLMCFLPLDAEECARLRELLERVVRAEGQRVLGWREVPVDTGLHVGRTAGACRPAIWQLFVGAGAGLAGVSDAGWGARGRGRWARLRPGRLRAQALRDPPRLRARPRRRGLVRDLELLAHPQLQGHVDLPPARRLLPRPARPAHPQRAGARALALLDQHLPLLGAGAPLPRGLPQRGVQHRYGQRLLDARPRVRAPVGAVRRRPPQDPARREGRRLGLRDLRPRARAAAARRALAAARGDDDDPRGLPRTRRPAAGAEATSTPSTPA